MKKYNVTAREDQDDCRDEEPKGKGKSGPGVKDGKIGSARALAGEGREASRGD
jgi:hypothetical protein